MALQAAVDLSGGITHYLHKDAWAAPAWYKQVFPSLADIVGYFDDPTEQDNPDGSVTKFAYAPANTTLRLMSDIWDASGNLTHYDFNASGLRTKEQHYGGNVVDPATLVAETDYLYGSNTTYPGVVTQKNVLKLSGDPSWGSSLTMNYTLDGNTGRIVSQVVDPGMGNLALTTNYTYSNTGDLLSTEDPRGNTTSMAYDNRHRLISTLYPDSTSRNLTYDARGNELTETDELGRVTVNQYNPLNRLTASVRIMTGTTSNITSGLATAYTYSETGARLTVTPPNGCTVATNGTVTANGSFTTTYTYDDLNRLTQVSTPPVSTNGSGAAALVTTFSYGNNSGGNVFESSSFKPTTVVDPAGYETDATYDPMGRVLGQSSQYDISGNYWANVTNSYDSRGNLIEKDVDLGVRSAAPKFGITPLSATMHWTGW